MFLSDAAFKNSKFLSLSSNDKNLYISFKLKDYFNSHNNFAPDQSGHLQVIWTNQVSILDFYNEVSILLSDRYTLISHKQFVTNNGIRINDNIKRILKMRDVEKLFNYCFEVYISPIFEKLRKEASEKKHAEAKRNSDCLKIIKEQEELKQKEQEELKQKEINTEKEKKDKYDNFKKMVLELGSEWEEDE
jgi:hypothetical protein